MRGTTAAAAPSALDRAMAETPVRLSLWELYHAPWRVAQRWIEDVRARVVKERDYSEPVGWRPKPAKKR